MTFNEEFGRAIIGHTVVVGFNHADEDGELIRKTQDFGLISEVSEAFGIVIIRPDGSSFTVPPDFSSMKVAEPGIYTMRSSKVEVENPSYTMVWSIYGSGTNECNWFPAQKPETTSSQLTEQAVDVPNTRFDADPTATL
jgi:hypothetical protein